MKTKGKYILATILILFGLLTLFLTSSVLLDLFGIRAKEGNYVLVVVWANFIAGILYLLAAIGILQRKTWIVKPLLVAVAVLIIGQILFFVHIVNGGLYETKTVGAMIFRVAMTVLLAIFASTIKRQELKAKN
ncbi:MAG: hypothetical protein GQ574_15405 [Crocinitomix sp.]|nr:hypothetical protein [Crocinitomix sp.]